MVAGGGRDAQHQERNPNALHLGRLGRTAASHDRTLTSASPVYDSDVLDLNLKSSLTCAACALKDRSDQSLSTIRSVIAAVNNHTLPLWD